MSAAPIAALSQFSFVFSVILKDLLLRGIGILGSDLYPGFPRSILRRANKYQSKDLTPKISPPFLVICANLGFSSYRDFFRMAQMKFMRCI